MTISPQRLREPFQNNAWENNAERQPTKEPAFELDAHHVSAEELAAITAIFSAHEQQIDTVQQKRNRHDRWKAAFHPAAKQLSPSEGAWVAAVQQRWR